MTREMNIRAGAELARLRGTRSQFSIELNSGIGQGVLAKIERGKRHPKKETLQQILNTLDAKYSEQRRILEMFGYVAPATSPDQQAIQWALQTSKATLDAFPFPAYLLDCTHRIHAINSKVHNLIGRTHNEALAYVGMSIIELVYADYGIGILVDNPDEFHPTFIQVLRREMEPFSDTTWYTAMMEAYAQKHRLFAKYWNAPPLHIEGISSRQLARLQLDTNAFGILTCYIFSEPFVRDMRFRIVHYLPADPKTMEIMHRW